MLGVNRARYESEVLSQRRQNEFLVSTFNSTFRSSMADYSLMLGNLAQKLNTFTPCPTCSDPWHARQKLVEDLQNLNDRYGYILDYQLSIGNTNQEVVNAYQNFTAQRPFFEKQLQMIRDNAQQTTNDKDQFQADLAKLEQTIRIATALVPIGTKRPPLQLVRANYVSEDVAHDDDPLYRAEVANYIEAETQFVQQAFTWIQTKLELDIAEQAGDKNKIPNATTKVDAQTTALKQSLVNWQRIRANALTMEQQFGFVIIARNVFEPHTDMTTAPPILLPNELKIPHDEDDAKDMAQRLNEICTKGLQSCQKQFDQLSQLDVWDKKPQQTEHGLEEIRALRETIRALRVVILDMLRSAQFIAFGLTQWKEHGPSKPQQPSDFQKQLESLSEKQFSDICELLTDALGTDFFFLESKFELLIEDFAVWQTSHALVQKRLSGQPVPDEMEKDIEKSQTNTSQTKQRLHNVWNQTLKVWKQLRDFEQKWNVSLALTQAFADSVDVALIDEKVDNPTKYIEVSTAIQTKLPTIKRHKDEFQASVQQLHTQNNQKDFARDIPPFFQARQVFVYDLATLTPLVKCAIEYLESQPRPTLEYVDNDDLGYMITRHLLVENELAQAQLDYYTRIATWLEFRRFFKAERSKKNDDQVARGANYLQNLMQIANEKRKNRDECVKKVDESNLEIHAKELSTGYNLKKPDRVIANPEVFVIEQADEKKKLDDFKKHVKEQEEKLQKEHKYLQDVVDVEMDSKHDKTDLKAAKKFAIDNLAPFIDRDNEFDVKFHIFLNMDVCKSHFVVGSQDYIMCVASRCGDSPSDCQDLFDNNPLNEECEDVKKCKVALSVCQNAVDCETNINKLRKPEAKINHYCATTFAPYNEIMYRKCLGQNCESQDTNNVCKSLQEQVAGAQEKAQRLEVELTQIVKDIPILSVPQPKQLEIGNNARQDPNLNVILDRMVDDLQSPNPSSIGEIGPLVNMRHKTLVAIKENGSPVLIEAQKEWERWLHATIDVMKIMCAKEPWCLQKAKCTTDACADLVNLNKK